MGNKLNFHEHIKHIRGKTLQRLRQIFPAITTNEHTLKQNITLYTSLIRLTLLHASPAWGHITSDQINKLQVIQNRFSSMITGSDRYTPIVQLQEITELPYIKNVIKDTAKKLKTKYTNHTNTIIRNIGTTHLHRNMTFRTPISLTT